MMRIFQFLTGYYAVFSLTRQMICDQYDLLVPFKGSEGGTQLYKVLVTTIAVFSVRILH